MGANRNLAFNHEFFFCGGGWRIVGLGGPAESTVLGKGGSPCRYPKTMAMLACCKRFCSNRETHRTQTSLPRGPSLSREPFDLDTSFCNPGIRCPSLARWCCILGLIFCILPSKGEGLQGGFAGGGGHEKTEGGPPFRRPPDPPPPR